MSGLNETRAEHYVLLVRGSPPLGCSLLLELQGFKAEVEEAFETAIADVTEAKHAQLLWKWSPHILDTRLAINDN